MARKPPRTVPLPSKDEVRRFVRESDGRVGKREISRRFGLTVEHRAGLRELLKSLESEGAVAPAGHRRFAAPGRLPDALVVVVTGTDLANALDVVVGDVALPRASYSPGRNAFVGDAPTLPSGTYAVTLRSKNCSVTDTGLTYTVP
jgi:hypothetical protein